MTEFVARAEVRSPAAAHDGFDASVFGVLAPWVRDHEVTDVFVNPSGTVWVDRGAGAQPVDGLMIPAAEARELATRLIAVGDRHVDESKP